MLSPQVVAPKLPKPKQQRHRPKKFRCAPRRACGVGGAVSVFADGDQICPYCLPPQMQLCGAGSFGVVCRIQLVPNEFKM